MNRTALLNVNGVLIHANELSYQDLVWLYRDFIERNGTVPKTSDGKTKNNLPQCRIIKKILVDNKITYNDFMLQFNNSYHVRSQPNNYNYYIERYLCECKKIGRAFTLKELNNNTVGLPKPKFFITYCPNKKVKTYDEFIQWCGLENNSLKIDDDYVRNQLVNLEQQLKRPITQSDIKTSVCGFSMIVVNRIWGNLNNAKKELHLLETPKYKGQTIDYYKNKLDYVLQSIELHAHRKTVSWKDIENPEFNLNGDYSEHKTYIRVFKKNGQDVFTYIKSKGFDVADNYISMRNIFDDGEKTASNYEYDLSYFLRTELRLQYNNDYYRDVLYSSFSNEHSRMNCDYCIILNDTKYYIEVAGLLKNTTKTNWHNAIYKSNIEKEYKDKMLKKEKLLSESGNKYLILLPDDMSSGRYKKLVNELLFDKQSLEQDLKDGD